MKRRTILVVFLGAVATAAAVFGPFGVGRDFIDRDDEDLQSDELAGTARETAEVTVRNLESSFESTTGNIVFGQTVTVADPQPGTVGWIIEAESAVVAGDILYERDQFPVTLMAGDVPAWRTMTTDDVGIDVEQLERNLVALGYGTEDELTVDDTYTSATAAIVQRWQADLGVAETGSVELGDVVFDLGADRVGSVSAVVGDATTGGELLTLTTSDRWIEFAVGADAVGFVSPGSSVAARLPDRSTVLGTVASVAPAGSGTATVTAAMTLEEDQLLPTGDAIPISVTWTEIVAADALTVPAGSIVRLDRGLYAVEVVTDRGTVEIVPVEVGLQIGALVQIVSGVEDGAEVISP